MQRTASSILALFVSGCLAPLTIPATVAPERAPAELARIEALAEAPADTLPTEVRLHEVARHWFAGWQVGAPDRDVVAMSFVAVQVVTPEGTVLIDLPHPRSMDHRLTGARPGTYDDAAFEAALAAAEAARHVVVTHEHFDHVAAFALERMASVRARSLVLTEAQRASRTLRGDGGFPDALVAEVKRTAPSDGPHLLAPGIVLVPLPGHTPGTQLVYVRTASGQRLLFVGDVAWHASNFEVPRGKPRLVHALLGEDGEAMAHQLRWLHEAMRDPGLTIVSAHDGEQQDRLVAEGKLGRGLVQ